MCEFCEPSTVERLMLTSTSSPFAVSVSVAVPLCPELFCSVISMVTELEPQPARSRNKRRRMSARTLAAAVTQKLLAAGLRGLRSAQVGLRAGPDGQRHAAAQRIR